MKTQSIWCLMILLLISCIQPPEQLPLKKNENEKATNAESLQQWRLMRRGGMYDMGKLMEGKKYADRMLKLQADSKDSRDGGLSGWEWKGPGNIGGRVRAIAVKSNGQGGDEIFVGAAGGGIWHSTDNGSSWTAVNDFLPSLAITSIQIDPANDQVMYASTGEGFGGGLPGAGIFKSIDGGSTWDQLPSTNNDEFRWVNRIAIDPDTTSTLFAVTAYARIWRSDDAGNTWTLRDSTVYSALDVKIDPNNSNHILVGCNPGLYESINGGDTFVNITGGNDQLPSNSGRVEIAFAPSDSSVIYASLAKNKGEIWRSINGGSTWTLRNTGTNHLDQGWYNNSLWVNPEEPEEIVVGGVEIWRSTNGGMTLTQISDKDYYPNGTSAHADNHIFVPSTNYTSDNPIVYVGNDGGIQKANNIWTVTLTNGWTNLCGTTLGITQFYGGAAMNDGSVYMGGTQDNGSLMGSTPAAWVQKVGGDGAYAAINPVNTDIRYHNINYNTMRKATNGQTFNTLARFTLSLTDTLICPDPYNGCVHQGIWRVSDNPELIGRFILDPSDPNTLWVGNKRLWKNASAMDPYQWQVAKDTVPGKAPIESIDASDNADAIWVGYGWTGRIERSDNGGSSWSGNLNTGDMPDNTVTDIDIHPTNSAKVLLSIGGYHQDGIWYTQNNGATWQNRSLPFDMQVNTILWHPVYYGWIYAGTDVGIFASEDYGVTWSVTPLYQNSGIYNNEGPVYTEVSELFWQGDGTPTYPYRLCAATHGRGLWVSSPPVNDVLYVDKDYVGIEDGSFTRPFNTFQEAYNSGGNNAIIKVLSADTHDEILNPFTIKKQITIELLDSAIIIE